MKKTKSAVTSVYNTNANLPTLSNSIINIPNGDIDIAFASIKKSTYTAPSAAVAQVERVTIAGTFTAGDRVAITIQYGDGLESEPQYVRKTFYHTVQVGATAIADVHAAFKALIDAYAAATGAIGATLATVSPNLDIVGGESPIRVTAPTAFTVANQVAFAQSVGQPADLIADGVNSALVTGTAYGVYEVVEQIDIPDSTNKATSHQSNRIIRLYAQQAPSDVTGDLGAGGAAFNNFEGMLKAIVDGTSLGSIVNTLREFHETFE